MAATPAPQAADSPVAVLAAVRAARVAADREEARILVLALDWAVMHPPESRTETAGWPGTGGSGGLGGERVLPLAGPGAPQVTEFCIAELAAALRISTDAGRSLLAEAIELDHRHLRTSPHHHQFLRDRTGTLDVTPTTRPRKPPGHRHLLPLPDP